MLEPPVKTDDLQATAVVAPAPYKRFLVALDSSEHANCGLQWAVELAAGTTDAQVTGIHVYAAQLHDNRFRQMEGGLPEQFRQEENLEEQRTVHDTLITRGLNLISQSYLDVGQRVCDQANIPYHRLAPEGKNYRALAQATQTGEHDLLVMGAHGVGVVPGEMMGGVCERVIRRTGIDTLVIKRVKKADANHPIIVAIDGSGHSYGGMLTAFEWSRRWGSPIILAAAYDPYYHYVVFNNISKVLSDEDAEVFRFEEQEKLHEDIIDSGLAKIYQAHLDVAQAIADDHGIATEAILLAGKPADALGKLLKERQASLLVMGKTGIHADEDLDIGRVTETVLRHAACDVLISLRTHTPELDRVAAFTTSWSEEAETRMARVPSFARKMARMAILRYAQERGHTVITERIVAEATAELMPSHAQHKMEQIVQHADTQQKKKTHTLTWHPTATAMLKGLADHTVRANVRLRTEKAARKDACQHVLPAHVAPFIEQSSVPGSQQQDEPTWSPDAMARLARVPEGFMRDATRKSILAYAKQQRTPYITLEVAEAGISRARGHMAAKMAQGKAQDGEDPSGIFHLDPNDPRHR